VLLWYSDLLCRHTTNLFNLPSPPPQPKVTFAASRQAKSFSRGGILPRSLSNHLRARDTIFEGYNIYHSPAASTSNPVLLATYDKKDDNDRLRQMAYDPSTGVRIKNRWSSAAISASRTLSISERRHKQRRPQHGSNYYFGVASYSATRQSGEPGISGKPGDDTEGYANTRPGSVSHSINPGIRFRLKCWPIRSPRITAPYR